MPQKAPWGQARIEVIALADEIREDLKRRVPVSQIFARLRETSRINMAERSFYRWVKELQAPPTAPNGPGAARPATAANAASLTTATSPRIGDASVRTLRFADAAVVEDELWDGGQTPPTTDLPETTPTEKEPSDGAD